jgi:hypothetical protein
MDANHTPVDLAYAAGFFDGEGNISILRVRARRAGGRDFYKVLAVTMNNDRAVLEALQSQFGGRLYDHLIKNKPTHWRPTYQWHLWGDDLEAFIQSVRPYLRVKGALADNALEFLALKHQAHASGKRDTPFDLWTRMKELQAFHRELIPKGRLGRIYQVLTPEITASGQLEMQEMPEGG